MRLSKILKSALKISMKTVQTPFGQLCLLASKGALVGLLFEQEILEIDAIRFVELDFEPNHKVLDLVADQIMEYCSGKRKVFEVPTFVEGTDFQIRVWNAVSNVEYGTCCSYKKIAEEVGCPGGYRAVGNVNRLNPLPLIVPCHRVVPMGGNIGGYIGGESFKKMLLEHEAKFQGSGF